MSTTIASNRIVQPYLFFEGRCEEALDFYQKAVGAKVIMKMQYKDNPDPSGCGAPVQVPGDKVMHASFQIGGTTLMAADGMCDKDPKFEGFSLSITAADEAEADKLFNALGDGGKVQMPLMKTFFSPRFGMVTDKFGVGWMIIVPGEMHG